MSFAGYTINQNRVTTKTDMTMYGSTLTDEAIFTVTGTVNIVRFYGVVTEAIGATVSTLAIEFEAVSVCAAQNFEGDGIGETYFSNGTLGGNLQIGTSCDQLVPLNTC